MLWKSVTLTRFVPFSHVGNTHVHIDFTQPATAILGGNGAGKSSLLRALTPFSPVRTDYGKDGKIEKVFEHNGSIFELTSDFSNATAPHSFKKDGIELNLSGTSETQKDLIEEHLGITKLIDSIVAGEVKICSLSKAQRKELFSATYPSDLSFVLDYFKIVCSQIRTYANQIKLLKTREATLRAQLIDEGEREKLKRFQEAANEVINNIDKYSLLMETEIKRYKSHEVLTRAITDPVVQSENDKEIIRCISEDAEEIRSGLLALDLVQLAHDSTSLMNELTKQALESDLEASQSREKFEKLTHEIESYRDELNQFIECRKNTSSQEDKERIEEELIRYERDLNELEKVACSDQSSVPVSKLDFIEGQYVPYLRQWIESIHSSTGTIMSREQLHDLGCKIFDANERKGTEVLQSLAMIQQRCDALKVKLEKLRSNAYPSSCKQICPLRDAVADNIRETQKMLDETMSNKSVIEKSIADAEEFVRVNNPVFEEQTKLHQLIMMEDKHMRELGLSEVVLQGEDIIDCCNEHAFVMTNRLLSACETTRLIDRKQHLKNEIESIKRTLATMSSVDKIKLSTEIIEKTIADREFKISQGIKDLDRLEIEEKIFSTKATNVKALMNAYTRYRHRIEDIGTLLNQRRVRSIISFYEEQVSQMTSAKFDLYTKLREVDHVLNEQQRTLDILSTEIMPTMKTLEEEKAKYEAVSKGLSPTSGLPCIYLVRFINRLIAKANEYIKSVWFYDMELIYLKEDEPLDFTIGALFRNNTSVDDISLCSNGQQAIIDLAMTLAICEERGFFEWLPIKFDETDATLTESHRTQLVELLNNLLDSGKIRQMLLVNHFAIQTGLSKCESVVLSTEGILVPAEYNTHAEIH